MQKDIALTIIFIVTTSSLFAVYYVVAQTRPAVPEFTLQIVDDSYDIAPTFTIDPYTGQNQTVTSGRHVERKFIEVKITNPPILTYSDGNKLYYSIRFKGHYEEWGGNEPSSESNIIPEGQYTAVRYGYGNENPGGYTIWLGYVAPGGMIDFQVQAILGRYVTTQGTPDICGRLTEYNTFSLTGRSGWSETQTVTIDPPTTATPEPSTSPAPTETPSESPSATATPSESPATSPTNYSPSPSETMLVTPSPTAQPLDASTLTMIIGVVALAIVVAVTVAVVLRRKPGTPK